MKSSSSSQLQEHPPHHNLIVRDKPERLLLFSGSVINGLLTVFGLNSWFLPFADVGMPANGVCWTITTMSFFYWTFPWLLPPMQRLTPGKHQQSPPNLQHQGGD